MSYSPVLMRRAALAVPCCLALILGGAAAHHTSTAGKRTAPDETAAAAPLPRSAPFAHTPLSAPPTASTHAPTRATQHRAGADPLLRADPIPSPHRSTAAPHRPAPRQVTPQQPPAPTKHSTDRRTATKDTTARDTTAKDTTERTSTKRTSTKHATTTQRTSGSSSSQMAYAVLAKLNSERAKHNLPPLRMNSRLISSAHAHNLAMAAHNTMSHQLPGEAPFGTRISRAGYDWRAAGENVGWNSSMTTGGALYLEQLMYNEGPGGGHYENIVSKTYRDVGIDVYLDRQHHKLWLTQDFGRAG